MVMKIKKKLIALYYWWWSSVETYKQLVEYITGMDTRMGYPNEHLAGNSDENIKSYIQRLWG
jgi:cell division protein FtsA